MRQWRIAISLLVAVTIGVAAWWFLKPRNYDECIIDAMKGATSDAAAREIVRSCDSIYSERLPPDPEVPKDVLASITGNGAPTWDGNDFSGTIYNGSKDWDITMVTIAIAPAVRLDGKTPEIRGAFKEYQESVTIKPQTTGQVFFKIIHTSPSQFGWKIASAKGHRRK